MANAMSNALAQGVLNAVFLNTALNTTGTYGTSLYVALHTADPDTGGSEVSTSGTGYARIQVTNWSRTNQTISNGGTVTFATATAGWGTVTHVAVWSASTSGTMLFSGALASSVVVSTNGRPEFSTGQIAFTID